MRRFFATFAKFATVTVMIVLDPEKANAIALWLWEWENVSVRAGEISMVPLSAHTVDRLHLIFVRTLCR